MNEIVWLEETATLASQYETQIRKAAQELWRGNYTRPGFVTRMNLIIVEGLTRAWFQGMRDVGASPESMSDAERQVLSGIIIANQKRVQGFANFIFANNKSRGGRWTTVNNRVKTWGNAYNSARNRAKTMAEKDPPLEWVLGPTEQHCDSCSKLSKKVKRASYWAKVNIYPQNPPNKKLDCKGYKCRCELRPTDKPISRGRLPGENR